MTRPTVIVAAVAALLALAQPILAAGEAAKADSVRFSGNLPRAHAVGDEFRAWVDAYAHKDLPGTMRIFDPAVRFSFQGASDQTYAQLQASYVQEFRGGAPTVRARNRSMDVLRRGDDGAWVIFRSINDPEK